MDHSKNYLADFLDGRPYFIRKDETAVFYKGEWREIYEDQEGEHYIHLEDHTRYFAIVKQINFLSDLLKLREHYKEYLFFAIEYGDKQLTFKQWFKQSWHSEVDQETGATLEYLQP